MNLRLYCQPIFNSPWVPLVLAASLLALLWIRPAFNSVTSGRRTVLNTLRAVVIVCAFLAMMRPTVVRTETKPLNATLAILVDDSRSMQTADVDDKTRYEVARQVVENLQPELKRLGKGFEFNFYRFSRSVDGGAERCRTAGAAQSCCWCGDGHRRRDRRFVETGGRQAIGWCAADFRWRPTARLPLESMQGRWSDKWQASDALCSP